MTAICLICLSLLSLKIGLLDAMAAPSDAVFRSGAVTQDLLAATVAAYIFFVLSFQIPQTMQRSRMSPAIGRLINMATGRGMSVLQMMQSASDHTELDPMSVDEAKVQALFSEHQPHGQAPILFGPAGPHLDWVGALAASDAQCREMIDQLWRYAQFLDTEALALMHAIENSVHSTAMMALAGHRMNNPDLSAWAGSYFKSYEAMRDLRRYGKAYEEIYASTGR